MLFVLIIFSLEKDSVVFSAFVNYNIMLCIEFSSLRLKCDMEEFFEYCSAFVSVNSIFGPMLLFYESYIVLVSHPDTNPAGQALTSVNFSITKLSDAQRARLNLW